MSMATGKAAEVGFFCGGVALAFRDGDPALELYATDIANDPCLQDNRAGNETVFSELLAMTCCGVGGEDDSVLLGEINIEAVGAPRLIVQCGGYGKNMMFLEKLNYSFLHHWS